MMTTPRTTSVQGTRWLLLSVGPTLLTIFATLCYSSRVEAIIITPTTFAATLETALIAGGSGTGITVTSSTLSANVSGLGTSSGTYTNGSGTYGIGPGIILASGNAADYGDGPNTTPDFSVGFGVPATVSQEALLDPITGGLLNHFDVTQFDIVFDVDALTTDVFFDVVFGSEEFDEFVGSSFIDAFGIYLNGTNIAFSGGLPVNIDHPDMTFLGGTELDGILAPGGVPTVTFSGAVTPGSTGNILTFIIADSGDNALDSVVYISALGSAPPPVVPEPSTLTLVTLGLMGMGSRRRRRT